MIIFKRLGTPDEAMWPGIKKVPDFTEKFPKFKPKGFNEFIGYREFDMLAKDLLERMLTIDPVRRITCREIKQHSFFQ